MPHNRQIVDFPTFGSARIRKLLILTVAASSQNRNGCGFAPLSLFLGLSCPVACFHIGQNRHGVDSGRPDACSSGTLQNHQIGDFEPPRPQPSESKTMSDLDVPCKTPQIRKIYGFRCPGNRHGQSHPVGRVQTCPLLSAGNPEIGASIVAKGRFPVAGQLAYQVCWFHRLTS